MDMLTDEKEEMMSSYAQKWEVQATQAQIDS
jgi:hypothetical protein